MNLDKNLIPFLRTDSEYFIQNLGEPLENGEGFSFPVQNLPFSSFKIRYDLEKKFLGKIYVMVLEGQFPGKMPFSAPEDLELRYSGFIKKGRPFFAPVGSKELGNNRDGVDQFLNQDQGLLEECWRLEIEFLKIRFDPQHQIWKVQVRPYGGSFLKILLPPLKYHVILIKDQAVLIFSVMKKIAHLLNNRFHRDSGNSGAR